MKKFKFVYYDRDDNVIAESETAAALAEFLGITTATVYNHVKGRHCSKSMKVFGTIRKVEVEELELEGFISYVDEEWKPINGFEHYEISNYGRVRKGLKLKKLAPSASGYIKVGLYKDGEQYTFYLHRLVGEHFLPDWDPSLVINHKDENKTNNHISNLEMMTRAENTLYSYNLHKDCWGAAKKSA